MKQLSDIGFYIMRVLWNSETPLSVKEIVSQEPALDGKKITDDIKVLLVRDFIEVQYEEQDGKKVKVYKPLLTEKHYAVRLIGSYQND